MSRDSAAGIAAAAAGVALLLFLNGGAPGLRLHWIPFLLAPAVATAAFLAVRRRRGDGAVEPNEVPPPRWVSVGLWSAALLFLLSGAAAEGSSFFLHWAPGNGLMRSGLARFCLLTAVFLPLAALPRKATWAGPCAAYLFSLALCLQRLGHATGWAALYRDDHPSFMYRFWVFAQSFPQLVYYDPFWNGGGIATFLVSTAVTPLGLLFWPAWRWLPVQAAYTPVLAAAFLVVLPLMAAASVRLVRGSGAAAWSAATLALAVSQYHFLWFLHFGAVGASFALPFFLMACACLYRVLWLDRTDKRTAALLIPSAAFFLAWPPAALLASAAAAGAVASARRWSWKKIGFLAACAAILALLVLPFGLALLRHRDPLSFAQAGARSVALPAGLRQGLFQLRDHLVQMHPCLVYFGLLGVWFLPLRGARALFGTAIAVLALFAGWGEVWHPSLQLSRAGIVLAFAAILPAALWIGAWTDAPGPRFAPARAAALALLFLGGYNAARIYGNQGIAPYSTMTEEVREMVTWVRRNTPADGRILFAGPTVHGYGRGHVALLPVLTGREMMAVDYFHFSPKRVEYQYPPRAFRETPEDVYRFIDWYNVSDTLTYHAFWKGFFRSQTNAYEERITFPPKNRRTVFGVRRKPDPFLRGAGRVEAGINRLDVTLADPRAEAVLRYNWADGLRAAPPAEVFAHEVGSGIRFIGIRPNGSREVHIRYGRAP